jgi:hypothetical protein
MQDRWRRRRAAFTAFGLAFGEITAAAEPDPVDDGPTEVQGERSGVVLEAGVRELVITLAGAELRPGRSVGVFLSDLRPDPRTGELVSGLRYAGDGRVTWAGGALARIGLDSTAGAEVGDRIVLGEATGSAATPAYVPPRPPVAAPDPPVPPPVVSARAPAPLPFETDDSGARLGSVHYDDRSGQSLVLWAGYADHGYDDALGTGGVAWRLRPRRGPALVEIGLDGLRTRRWVAGSSAEEPYGSEPVVGYWLWGRVDSPGLGLAVIGALGAGVDVDGLALGWRLGLRTGHPDRSRIELAYERRGALGGLLILDGRVAVADPVRIGLRTRTGDLARHDGDFTQMRADGAVVLSADVTSAWTLELGGGVGAYDLVWRDAGPVLDGAVEVRW